MKGTSGWYGGFMCRKKQRRPGKLNWSLTVKGHVGQIKEISL